MMQNPGKYSHVAGFDMIEKNSVIISCILYTDTYFAILCIHFLEDDIQFSQQFVTPVYSQQKGPDQFTAPLSNESFAKCLSKTINLQLGSMS